MAAMPGSLISMTSPPLGVVSHQQMFNSSLMSLPSSTMSMMFMSPAMMAQQQHQQQQQQQQQQQHQQQQQQQQHYTQCNTLTPSQQVYSNFQAYLAMASASNSSNNQYMANGDSRSMSPSRSVNSASPPAQGCCGTPTPTSPQDEEKMVEYLKELQAEKESLEALQDGAKTANAIKLIEQEISQIQLGILKTGGNYKDSVKYVDVYRERPIRLTVRVLVPVREHPKFNFVGKLLGPKGNSMKRLQEETMTKMAVLGKGSMRDKQKEEELRGSTDPKYQHLQEDLHVEITAFAPPAEAHARIAYALTELRKYLIPDSNDEIRQEQMREMELITVGTGDNSSLVAGLAGITAQSDLKKNCGGAVSCHASLAAMHPALRQTAAGLAAMTPQSIQSQAAAAAAALCGIPQASMAALAMRNSAAVSNNGQLMAGSPYLTAANPLMRKLIPTATGPMGQKMYGSNEEMLLDTTVMSQPEMGHSESGIALTGESLSEGWANGLKAPSAHYEQRSKFRQQAAPYNIRLN